MLALLIAASLTVSFASPAPLPRKGAPMPLERAVESSTLVCIGTVDQIVRAPRPDGWKPTFTGVLPRELVFGRVRVERVLLGDTRTEFVWHEVWGTWACDTTRSLDGKRALFLLGKAETDRQPDAARAAVAERLGSALVLRNVGTGEGLLPIELDEDGAEIVHHGGAPDALDLPRPGTAFPTRPNARRRGLQSLRAISDWIEELARFPSASCAIRMTSAALSEPRGQAFDARFLADGSYRIAIDEARRQTVRSGRIDAATWDELRASVELASAQASPLADASAAIDRRSLTVRLGGTDRTWQLPADVADASSLSAETRAARDALLTAWSLIHGAIECAECADHSVADERARSR